MNFTFLTEDYRVLVFVDAHKCVFSWVPNFMVDLIIAKFAKFSTEKISTIEVRKV